MTMRTLASAAALLALALPACSSRVLHERHGEIDPDLRLAELLDQLGSARERGPNRLALLEHEQVIADSGHLRNDLERLAVEFPWHAPTLFANAVLSHQLRDDVRAATFLDRILDLGGRQPEAAELRARIALESGNLAYAQRLLGEQVALAPDAPELREVRAAAEWLAGDFAAAERELAAAAALGAPEWRVAYHRGLLAEQQGDRAAALRWYEHAVAANPDCAEAAARRRALSGS